MPYPVTPRNLRGDARIDLDAQYDDLAAIAEEVYEFDKVWTAVKAHILRRAAHSNRKRHSALSSLDLADEREAWDGVERRRSTLTAAVA
jgi:hypothetical protein